MTALLASKAGLPISTTHCLVAESSQFYVTMFSGWVCCSRGHHQVRRRNKVEAVRRDRHVVGGDPTNSWTDLRGNYVPVEVDCIVAASKRLIKVDDLQF